MKKFNLFKMLAVLFVLITGINTAWAASGKGFNDDGHGIRFWRVPVGGSGANYDKAIPKTGYNNTYNEDYNNMGEVSALEFKHFWAGMWQGWDDNACYDGNSGDLYYNIHLRDESAGTFTPQHRCTWEWHEWADGYRHPEFYCTYGDGLQIDLVSGKSSGIYTFEFYYYCYYANYGGEVWLNNGGSGNYKMYYTIPVPASVSSYTITPSNKISGSGTQQSPYIITWGTTMRLSVSGSQSTSDANSSLYTKFGSNSYSSDTYIDLTPTTNAQSITVKSKYYNSAYDLSGAETAEQTIYYKWETPYTITVQTDGSGKGTVNKSTVYTKGDVASVSFSASVPSGDAAKYEFVNWSATTGVTLQSAATSATNTVKATQDGTVTANFRSRSYTVTYKDKDNETYSGSNGASLPTSYTYGTGIASLTSGIKAGYSFGGWYTASNCSSGRTTSIGTTATGDKTFYAKWNANITLDRNGGTGDGSATTIYKSDAKLAITAPTNAAGYYILGYYKEPACTNLVAAADGTLESNVSGYTSSGKWVASEDKTLYPKWDNRYTITLEQTGATTAGSTSATATYGSAMPAITIPHRNGYIFGGYYTDTSNENTKYYDENGASVKNWDIAANTTLHAKWTGIVYHVQFDANGGTGSMANQDFTYGTLTALNTNTFTRDGYYFLGWNSNADGSGTAYYNRKSVSEMTTTPGEIVTLFAQWAQMHTLYFLNMRVKGWHDGGSSAATHRYAYAFISYDGYELHPLGDYSPGSSQGTKMTAVSDITLPYVNNTTTWCWSIDNVPEGATIIFSDNSGNDAYKTGNLSGWTADKPYFCNGNSTWYALDGEGINTISTVTNMSVYIGAGDFGSWQFFALDNHTDGQYAIINLNNNKTYQYKYFNWQANDGAGTYSGAQNDNAYTIDGCSTHSDFGGPNGMNGSKDYMVKTDCHASGEYKFLLTWSGGTPQTTVRVPRGVNLTTTTPTEAKLGESVTVSFTANAWADPSSGSDMDNPTYYFEFSKDNSNWNTIATYSATSAMSANASYTFPAESGYFRVKLVNDNGVASYSGSTAFTAYTTKSFYLYNPWVSGSWPTLYLYTKNSGTGTEYNGSWPGGHDSETCVHGNNIVSKGNGWYYITIDERANQFKMRGNEGYETEYCSVSNYIQDAKYMLIYESNANKVKEYTAKGNKDYRLKYTYDSSSKTVYSPIYNTDLDGTTIPTSMWMDASQASTLVIERGNGDNSWVPTVASYSIGTSGGGLIDGDHRNHGYVFKMTLNTATLSVSNVSVNNGPFYVRTDGLEGGWNVYKTAKHTMEHSERSLSGSPAYNYYLCKWIGSGDTNVKFTIADDYNPELVAPLAFDADENDPLHDRETIPTATNVRFAWNNRTNTLTRAYLSAATDASARFLVLEETTDPKGSIYNENGQPLTTGNGRVKGLEEHELIFADNGNWIYQLVMVANPGAHAKVTANYNSKVQDFIEHTELIEGSGSTMYKYRIVYDFKTNTLTNAWMPNGDQINQSIELNTNAMLIRNGQGAATQISFGTGYKITDAKKMIGVMQFDYSNMVGRMSSWNSQAYKYCMYYFSFPYKVAVSDIFGIGEFGVDWRIQRYNGAKRAEKGWFTGDGTTTFWEDVQESDTLYAYEGYSLLLNRVKFNNGESNIWTNIASTGSVYLYFPSAESIGTIESQTQTLTVKSHVCTIDRDFAQDVAAGVAIPRNHKITDSNWNMIGSPLFQNLAGSTVTPSSIHEGTPKQTTLSYIYAWNSSDNTLAAEAVLGTGHTFNAMHAYMVQFAGTITFTGASITPHAIAARQKEETKNYMLELKLEKGETFAGRAYVELRENAVDSFLLNEDMYMMASSKTADLYTFAGAYDVAANVLSINNHIVPVGVNVKKAGTYTFSMPSNFDGEVILIDTYDNTRTNLGLEDYVIALNKGEINDRFLLEININKVPTAIDGVEDGSLKDGKAHKFIENGEMYILRDGKLYDARGNQVK